MNNQFLSIHNCEMLLQKGKMLPENTLLTHNLYSWVVIHTK